MLYEHRFDCRTEGLVGGPALLSAATPLVVPLAFKRTRFAPSDPKPQLWRPWIRHFTVLIRSRESGEVLWVRPYESEREAGIVYARLIGIDLDRAPPEFRIPPIWQDGELEYVFKTVETFNATPGGGTWTPASGVVATDYLNIAGGGGGGGNQGGGGGAGGYREAAGFAVTPGSPVTVTIGGAGAAGITGGANGGRGVDSVFSSVTSNGGGGGGNGAVAATAGTYGSGAGGGGASGTGGAGSNGTGGQGNNGAAGQSGGNFRGGGGGGASANGALGSGTGNGGDGTSSTISGSAVTRGGGGGGGCATGTAGTGGAGGGGNGSVTTVGSPGTANTGGGGGGGDNPANGALGGTGVLILAYNLPALRFMQYYRRRRT